MNIQIYLFLGYFWKHFYIQRNFYDDTKTANLNIYIDIYVNEVNGSTNKDTNHKNY